MCYFYVSLKNFEVEVNHFDFINLLITIYDKTYEGANFHNLLTVFIM